MSVAEAPFPEPQKSTSEAQRALGTVLENVRHGVSMLADHFTRARQAVVLPQVPLLKEATLAISVTAAIAVVGPTAMGIKYESSPAAPLFAGDRLAQEAGKRQLDIYQKAIDRAFRGKLVRTRTQDLGETDLTSFIAARQLDSHNPPNPQWTFAFSRPGQEGKSADLKTTLYFHSSVPQQEGEQTDESFQRVVTEGNITHIIGNPQDLVAGLSSVLGDAEQYQITLGQKGPAKDPNFAATARLVVDGQTVSLASLDQSGNFRFDDSKSKLGSEQLIAR